MMIYGQGAIRCHPYVLDEIEAAGNAIRPAAVDAFDGLLYPISDTICAAAARSLVMGFTGGFGSSAGRATKLAPYYRAMNRYSANLALISDVAMGTLGGTLKFRESLSGRLGDVLSNLYIASATLKRFVEDGEHAEDLPLVAWVCEQAFADIESALAGVLRHLPSRPAALIAGALIFPLGRTARLPSDGLGRRIARLVQTPGAARDRLTPRCYISQTKTDTALALFERAMQATLDTAELHKNVVKARKAGTIDADHPREQIDQAEKTEVLTADEAKRLRAAFDLQMAVIRVDDFDPEEMRSRVKKTTPDRVDAA